MDVAVIRAGRPASCVATGSARRGGVGWPLSRLRQVMQLRKRTQNGCLLSAGATNTNTAPGEAPQQGAGLLCRHVVLAKFHCFYRN